MPKAANLAATLATVSASSSKNSTPRGHRGRHQPVLLELHDVLRRSPLAAHRSSSDRDAPPCDASVTGPSSAATGAGRRQPDGPLRPSTCGGPGRLGCRVGGRAAGAAAGAGGRCRCRRPSGGRAWPQARPARRTRCRTSRRPRADRRGRAAPGRGGGTGPGRRRPGRGAGRGDRTGPHRRVLRDPVRAIGGRLGGGATSERRPPPPTRRRRAATAATAGRRHGRRRRPPRPIRGRRRPARVAAGVGRWRRRPRPAGP